MGLVHVRLVAVTALVVMGVAVVAAAPLGAAAVGRHDRSRAQEVCEDMVRESVVAAARRPLTHRQRGAWQGNRYTCAYDFGAKGTLRVLVDVLPSSSAAKNAYVLVRQANPRRATLFGLGQAAFSSGTTLVAARKDRFLLRVDGSSLARSLDRSAITWSTTRAIFKCW